MQVSSPAQLITLFSFGDGIVFICLEFTREQRLQKLSRRIYEFKVLVRFINNGLIGINKLWYHFLKIRHADRRNQSHYIYKITPIK